MKCMDDVLVAKGRPGEHIVADVLLRVFVGVFSDFLGGEVCSTGRGTQACP
jgi:hypothetical protein